MPLNSDKSVTIIYTGEINREGYEKISKVCENLGKDYPKTVDLILSTYGGDPDAGFRIARCLQHYFTDGITLYVPHYCKSAGTLIAIGANKLVLSDGGELGPLDVQIIKADEMFERSSGMDITQGFNVLSSQAYEMFHNITVNLKMQTRLSTKLAAEAASQITVGAFAPIFAQIDPNRLGETQRASEIAFKYGNLLNEKFNNLHPNGVTKLVAGYPSHGFVIDRKEARSIFKEVRAPLDDEVDSLKSIDRIIRGGVDLSSVFCVNIDSFDRGDNDNESTKCSQDEPVSDDSIKKGDDRDVSDTKGTKTSNTGSRSRKQKSGTGDIKDASEKPSSK